MSNGTLNRRFVTAVPASENIRKDYPRVAGVLDVSDSEFMGETFPVYTVHCLYEDGTDNPVEVQESGIQEANERRSPKTVMTVGGESDG